MWEGSRRGRVGSKMYGRWNAECDERNEVREGKYRQKNDKWEKEERKN